MGKIGELIMTSSFCDSHRKATFLESFRLAIENWQNVPRLNSSAIIFDVRYRAVFLEVIYFYC